MFGGGGLYLGQSGRSLLRLVLVVMNCLAVTQ